MRDSNTTFSAFAGYSDTVVKNVVAGKADIGRALGVFANNTAKLDNCTTSNKTTTATEYLLGRLNTAGKLPQPITPTGAQEYSAYASGLSSNASSIVASCSKSGTFSASPGLSISIPSFNIGSAAEYIIIAAVIIIAGLYMRSVLVTRREMQKIRGEHEGHEDSQGDGYGGHEDSQKEVHGSTGEGHGVAPDESGSNTAGHVEDDDFVQKVSKDDGK